MSWTKTGTVSVTNGIAVVFGTGTTWSSGGKTRPGDAFMLAGVLYEVLSVQSNTQITLTSAYLGVTASAQPYALLHIGLLPAELAVGISELQSKYLTTIAQLYEWETSVAATVPLTNPGTGVTAQVKPIAGLISDIGLKAPLASPVFSGNVGIGGMPGAKLHVYGGLLGGLIVCHNGTSSSYFDSNRIAFRDADAFERVVIDSTGVQVTRPIPLGYGSGAGGSVTQATSKSTAVTLNKPCGQITMHNAALPLGAVVTFRFLNSILGAADVVNVSVGPTAGTGNDYETWCSWTAAQECYLSLRNCSGASRSDAVVLNFAIIKGAAS